MFDVLPPELITEIFTYVLPTDALSLEIESTADFVISDDSRETIPCASLRRDPQYLSYRSRQPITVGHSHWPDEVEDAFFQGIPSSSP